MPPQKNEKVLVVCPKCGHRQKELPSAYSTFCKKCNLYFRVQYVHKAEAKPREVLHELRRIICFQCRTELTVPLTAESTMCKRCSAHVDLRDYEISSATSKNFRTKGRFTIHEKGFLFNTDSLVGAAVIKGKFLGKLTVEGALEIHPTAEIKGSFRAGKLIIPLGTKFRWKEDLKVGGAEIRGDLVANLQSDGTVVLTSTARYFGDVEARSLVVESGAVFVGTAKTGRVRPETNGSLVEKAAGEPPPTEVMVPRGRSAAAG
jgi:cytoskeletal protein CcmA (bactofilin family)